MIENEDPQVEVTYKFILPRDADEKNLMDKASDMYSAISDIDDICRSAWKYGTDEDVAKFAEEIRGMLWRFLD